MSSQPPHLPPEQAPHNRLRQAVRGAAAPPHLQVKIRQQLDQERQRKATALWARPWVPVAALLLVGVAGGLMYRAGHRALPVDPQEVESAALLSNVSQTMRPGLDDHLHCSVYGGNPVPDRMPALAEAVQDLPPQFRELLAAVQRHIPEQFRIYSAHECLRSGRKFVHLQLTTDSQLLSVIVTRRGVDESFVRDKIIPSLAGSGTSIYQAKTLRFQLAALETRDYLAYVVSDLSEQQNLDLMTAMAPEIRLALQKLES
jgi:hypothetical protein